MAFGMHKKRKLRNIIVNRGFQIKYAAMLVSWVFALSCLLSMILFGILHQQARERTLSLATASGSSHIVTITVAALIFAALTSIAIAIWTIFMSHRICGPLMMVHRWLEQVTAGEYPFVRPFRKGDEFKELQIATAELVKVLKTRDQESVEEFSALATVARGGLDGSEKDCRKALKQINEQLATMEQVCSQRCGEKVTPKFGEPSLPQLSVSEPAVAKTPDPNPNPPQSAASLFEKPPRRRDQVQNQTQPAR